MRLCRFGAATWLAFAFHGCVWLALAGCGQEEPLEADPGASPFFPGPSASKASGSAGEKTATTGSSPSVSQSANADLSAARPLEGDQIDTRFGTNDVEKRLRAALRTAQKDPVAAAEQLDRLLEIEPIHREALFGRSALALDQSKAAGSLEERSLHVEKALGLARALLRAYDNPKPHEKELFARVLYRQTQVLTEKGEFVPAVALVREASELGFDAFGKVDSDPALKSLRATPQYTEARKADDALKLATARERTKGFIDPIDVPFDFTHPDLAGKKVSLRDFKGKVVVIDFWGTWCGPCREAIPRLIDLYNKKHALGLEIIGLSYERDATSQDQAVDMVKKFVDAAHVPYPCLMGDGDTIKQVPGFKGFPTTVIIDRAGKVRLFVTENSAQTVEIIGDVVRVLLAEPAPAATSTSAPAATSTSAPAAASTSPTVPAAPSSPPPAAASTSAPARAPEAPAPKKP